MKPVAPTAPPIKTGHDEPKWLPVVYAIATMVIVIELSYIIGKSL